LLTLSPSYPLPSSNNNSDENENILGFAEVTVRKFGIGKNYENESGENWSEAEGYTMGESLRNYERLRPIVSNLVVSRSVRRSGVATRLMDRVEDVVRQWGYSEIVLQVEEENEGGRVFYEKRGCVARSNTRSEATGRRIILERPNNALRCDEERSDIYFRSRSAPRWPPIVYVTLL